MSAEKVLKQYFGYDSFRTGQKSLIDAIHTGRDALGVMPTGAGKSLCFQVPALLFEGISLIVSPLISLMKDQVGALRQAGVAAAFLNSSLTARQINAVLHRAAAGEYKLIYIAPERLLSADFLSFARNAPIAMLAVDEAHCISQWGQDFRPSYAQIPAFLEKLPTRPVVAAFTATATPRVRADIEAILELQDPAVLVTGFDRENLFLEVQAPKQKFATLLAFVKKQADKCGIVYCSTRANVEQVCEKLCAQGYAATRYHAGLPDLERHENQDKFLFDRAQIMVATNAFGMGIDKSNVSFIVHYNMPKDLESYYQEAGRAGRDGSAAACLLLYSGQDVQTNLWMIENARENKSGDDEAEEQLKERERLRLREMVAYSTTSDCLRGFILAYFGEHPAGFCAQCSNCRDGFDERDISIEGQKILSCVVRLRERFGMTMVIGVLRGSKNEKLQGFGFDKLSTYGISQESEKSLRAMIDHLLREGYLLQSAQQFPILSLGPKARALLKGEVQVQMKLPRGRTQQDKQEQAKLRASAQQLDGALMPLFDALRTLRQSISQVQGVPAFVVFSDATLRDMCIRHPRSEADFLAVSGVGSEKNRRYGKQFLAVLEQHPPVAPAP